MAACAAMTGLLNVTQDKNPLEALLQATEQLRRLHESTERFSEWARKNGQTMQRIRDAVSPARLLEYVRVQEDAAKRIKEISDLNQWMQTKSIFIGKTSKVEEFGREIRTLPADQKPAAGEANNFVKGLLVEAFDEKKLAIESAALSAKLATERADVTLPVRMGGMADGRIHPVSQVFDEIAEIFADMGFRIAEGPDIESDDLNFTKLNIPPEHPARQMHDTFYLNTPNTAHGTNASPFVLRTHTSPVQIRTMMNQKPPIRIIAPGRVYRMDSDATHTPMFHQIEGLVIDESTHFGHMKWCLEEFCKAFFEVEQVKMRFRASHFPFTEPSAEVDVGAEAIGKPGQWLEILGCGMVHPKVDRQLRLGSREVSGLGVRHGP